MSQITDFLLNECFWAHYDAGVPPDKTPLLTGIQDETPLTNVVGARFEVSRDEAEKEIAAARSEVQL